MHIQILMLSIVTLFTQNTANITTTCDCFEVDMVTIHLEDSSDICYIYKLNPLFDSLNCLKSINYITLGAGDLNECNLNLLDIHKEDILKSAAPKSLFQIDSSNDGTYLSGVKLNILSHADTNIGEDTLEFSLCFDSLIVGGTQMMGEIEISKSDTIYTCDAPNILPDFCHFIKPAAPETKPIINERSNPMAMAASVTAASTVSAANIPAYVVKFSPKWMFKNSNGNGYPMNPQMFYDFMISSNSPDTTLTNAAHGKYYEWSKENGNAFLENNDFTAIYNGLVPTLYAINRCSSGRIHILYYIPYGFQHSCSTCFEKGSHQGGFELVTIVLNESGTELFGAYFKQHSGYYFRSKGSLELDGNHVKVYVGKYAHGTYDNKQGNDASIDSMYWADPRNGDKTWIPNANELYDITNINSYTFDNNNEPPMWNGLLMEFMKVSSENEFPASAHDSKHKYGKEFFKKIGKLTDNVCDYNICKGQSRVEDAGNAKGCERASCFEGKPYTDMTKDRPYRCKEGCGKGWKAFGDECCKTEMGVPYKCKDRKDYARNNQDFEI